MNSVVSADTFMEPVSVSKMNERATPNDFNKPSLIHQIFTGKNNARYDAKSDVNIPPLLDSTSERQTHIHRLLNEMMRSHADSHCRVDILNSLDALMSRRQITRLCSTLLTDLDTAVRKVSAGPLHV